MSNRSSAAHEWFPYPPYPRIIPSLKAHEGMFWRRSTNLLTSFDVNSAFTSSHCLIRMFWKISNTLESRNSGVSYLYINYICMKGWTSKKYIASYKGNITQICKRNYEHRGECQTISKLKSYWVDLGVCLSVRRCICVEKKNQLDATELFIALIICSTCFGYFYAHHQELATICMLLPPIVCSALIAGCRWSGAG